MNNVNDAAMPSDELCCVHVDSNEQLGATVGHWTATNSALMAQGSRADFQVIHNNTGFAPYIDTCVGNSAWNGYLCHRPTLTVLKFENKDPKPLEESLFDICFIIAILRYEKPP